MGQACDSPKSAVEKVKIFRHVAKDLPGQGAGDGPMVARGGLVELLDHVPGGSDGPVNAPDEVGRKVRRGPDSPGAEEGLEHPLQHRVVQDPWS